MPRTSTAGMTELEKMQEQYRFMVGMFSIAIMGIITVSMILYSKCDAQPCNPAIPETEAYAAGWERGYLRAIMAASKALESGDTIRIRGYEHELQIDSAGFMEFHNIK